MKMNDINMLSHIVMSDKMSYVNFACGQRVQAVVGHAGEGSGKWDSGPTR